jgi:hypothetical protein
VESVAYRSTESARETAGFVLCHCRNECLKICESCTVMSVVSQTAVRVLLLIIDRDKMRNVKEEDTN